MQSFKTIKWCFDNNILNTHDVFHEKDKIVKIFQTGDIRFYTVYYHDNLSDIIRSNTKVQVSKR